MKNRLLLMLLVLLAPSMAYATVTSTATSVSFTCTNSTGPFSFTFPISDPTAMTVIQNGIVVTTGNYTIASVNNNYSNGGIVTLNVACPAGQTLVLQRITPILQQTVFTPFMPALYANTEDGLDKLTEIDQEQAVVAAEVSAAVCPAGNVLQSVPGPICVPVGSSGTGSISALGGQPLAASGTQGVTSTSGGPASLPNTVLAANTVLADYAPSFNAAFASSGTLNWSLPQGVFPIASTVTIGQNGETVSGQAWGQNDFNPHPTNLTATAGLGANPMINLFATGNGFNAHLNNLNLTGADTAGQTGINVTGSVLSNSTWNVLEVDHVAVENVPNPWKSVSIGNSFIHDCFMQGDTNSTGYLMDFGGTHGQNNVTVRDCYGNGEQGGDSGSAPIAPALGFLWFEEGTSLHAWLNDVDGIAGPEVRCGNTSSGFIASCELHLKNNEVHRGPMVYCDRFSACDTYLGNFGNQLWLGPAIEMYTGSIGQVHFTAPGTQLAVPPTSVVGAVTGGATLSGTVFVCVYEDNTAAIIPDGAWTGDWHNSCSSAVAVTLTGGQNSIVVTVPVVYSTANNSGITYNYAYGTTNITANMNVVQSTTATTYTILGTETPITNPPGQSNGSSNPPINNIPAVTLASASASIDGTCPRPVSGAASTTSVLGWNYDASPFDLCGTGITHSSTAGGAPSRGTLDVGRLDAESCPPGSTTCVSKLYVTEDNYASSVETNPLNNLLAQQLKIFGTVCGVNGTGSSNLIDCEPTVPSPFPATLTGSANATQISITDTGAGSGVMQQNVINNTASAEIPLLLKTNVTGAGNYLLQLQDSLASNAFTYGITNSIFLYPHTFTLLPNVAATNGTNQSSPSMFFQANGWQTTTNASGAVNISFKTSINNTTNTPIATWTATGSAAANLTPTYFIDFTGMTQFKHPLAAGYTTGANGEIGYDTTNLNWHTWDRGVDSFLAVFPVASPPTTGHIAGFLNTGGAWTLQDLGAPGGTGTVTSVTFTGNGVVDSATPSTAVTASGTVTATLLTQAANTVFGNFTSGTAAPTFSNAPVFSAALLTGFPTFNQNTTGSAGSVTNALTLNNSNSGAASGSTYNGSAAVTASANTFGAGSLANTNAWSGVNNYSVTGAASTPGVSVTGAPFTGGSSTTNFPQLYVNCTGATGPTTFSANGTMMGVNGCSGFTGNLIDLHQNGGASMFSVSRTGVGAFASGLTASGYNTSTNCSNAAAPAVCGSAAAGAVTIPAGSTTVTVNTSAVTANSRITLTADDSLTIAATTCNSTLATLVGGMAVTARTAGTSFTVTYNGTIITNPLCLSFSIIN